LVLCFILNLFCYLDDLANPKINANLVPNRV
jgi:hypothetical protein